MTDLLNELRQLAEDWESTDHRNYEGTVGECMCTCADELTAILDKHAMSTDSKLQCYHCGEYFEGQCECRKPTDSSEYRLFELTWEGYGPRVVVANGLELSPGGVIYDDNGEALRHIGYKYAESDVITCIGPNAWWAEDFTRDHVPSDYDRRLATGCANKYPIFATHAVYAIARKENDR